MATAAPKVTVMSGGVPYTAGSQAKAQAMASKDAAPVAPSGSAKTDPARGTPGWIDPIRAPGDTTYTDKFGTPNAADVAGANGPGTPPPGWDQTTYDNFKAANPSLTPNAEDTQHMLDATGQPQTATEAQKQLPGALNPTAPVITPPASPTPMQNKYAAGLDAAKQSGAPPPVDAGAGRTAVTTYMPPQQPDTGPVDSMIQSDPGMAQVFSNLNKLLNAKDQTTSLMDDYNKLYAKSGLADINTEIINADKVINGTEDDVRNEIQKAGGFGTDSQVQALSLARNKSLLTRYNQLVQMKTDATNQLNTMMQLDTNDKQMAQQKLESNITNMFSLANFRQTALQNVRQQQQFLLTNMGADGYYASVSHDPKQLSMAEQIMGLAPGGLQEVAKQAAQTRALDNQQKQAAIYASNASAASSAANTKKTLYDLSQEQNPTKANAAGVASAADALTAINKAKGQVSMASTGSISKILNPFGVNPYRNDLKATLETIKSGITLESLAALKANSPTGASGLGALSDTEGALLAAKVANIDASQSEGQLRTNLDLVKEHYKTYLKDLGYGYDEATGNIITP